MKKYDVLKLENQLCFPLYACSREVVKKYRPFLDAIGLTYTQYIAMLVLWEDKKISVKELGKKLYLDSGTLSPMLKSLEAKGLVTRTRYVADERLLIVELTEAGEALREKALVVPEQIKGCIKMDEDKAKQLYELLYELLTANEE
ncbi:MAG: MarR family transcriptional regulator [Anaerofustis stercorihominis]|nr:MarR family transcriptional regulator [Anaerofustis stercorihominis]